MTTRPRWHALTLALTLSLLLVAACGDDDEPAGPGGTTDTTAPQSVGNDPGANDSEVGLDEEVRVTFSEPMKTSSATGNVSLSVGTITGLSWENGNRTLVIEHTTWPEGVQVTVTIGADLEDVAGNKLGSNYVFSFWTLSSQLAVLAMNPADGATGVTRNALISLLFSRRMNLTSLAGAITVSDAGKVDYPFTILGDEENWVSLAVNDPLPASTLITVSVSTAAQDDMGNFLPAAASFSFTTGTDVDDTPPTLVSAEPPSGSTVSQNQAFLRLTFSEPMDPTLLEPSRINAEFLLLVGEASPSWNADFTVLTVPLPTPLPPGTPMEVEFATLTDRNGVVQTTPTTWSAKVAGTPDYFPVVDGARSFYFEYSEDGTIGNTIPDFTSEDGLYVQFETQGGGTFRWAFYDPDFLVSDEWDIYRKTSSEVLWTGFHEVGEGGPQDVTITPGVRMVNIPPRAATWTISATASDGIDTYDVDGSGETIGQDDLPLPAWFFSKTGRGFLGKAEPVVYWKDAWKVEGYFEVSVASEVFLTSSRTMWFAANVGLVQAESYEEDLDENRWDRTETYLIPFVE